MLTAILIFLKISSISSFLHFGLRNIYREQKLLNVDNFSFWFYSGGLEDNDVIISINNHLITSSSDVSEAIKKDPSLSIVVRRGNRDVIINVVTEEIEP